MLKALYKVINDWTGSLYKNRHVDISLPSYIAKFLHKFYHATTSRHEDAPHRCARPNYGAKFQFTVTPLIMRTASEEKTDLKKLVGDIIFVAETSTAT